MFDDDRATEPGPPAGVREIFGNLHTCTGSSSTNSRSGEGGLQTPDTEG